MKHKNDKDWYNTDGLYSQYMCHCLFVSFKDPWNLEPARKDTATPFNRCNPK